MLADVLVDTARSLRAHMLRFTLTSLGIVWGIFTLTYLQATTDGFDLHFHHMITKIGSRLIVVFPGVVLKDRVGERGARDVELELEDLARLEVLESGKPIAQARGEMEATADLWDYAATLARHVYGDAYNTLGADKLGFVFREPVGVVGMITPWNFPLLIISQKLPFALAVGCTAVIKPSELTPGTTLRRQFQVDALQAGGRRPGHHRPRQVHAELAEQIRDMAFVAGLDGDQRYPRSQQQLEVMQVVHQARLSGE